jgi:hypothetical protein
VFGLEPDGPEGIRVHQAGVAADQAAVDVVGDDQRQFGVGGRERALEQPRFQHPEQQVDVAADETVTVEIHRPDVGRGPELDARGLARDVIVAADEATEPLGERVDDALEGDSRRHHDERAVAAVFAEAVRPADPGVVERLRQELVERLVQVEPDVVIAVRSGEADDVHGEQGAQLAISGRCGRPDRGRAGHFVAAVPGGPLRLAFPGGISPAGEGARERGAVGEDGRDDGRHDPADELGGERADRVQAGAGVDDRADVVGESGVPRQAHQAGEIGRGEASVKACGGRAHPQHRAATGSLLGGGR